MEDKPKPGTYGALERSTEPWNWKADLDRFMLTPERLVAFIDKMYEELKNDRKS